jgi:hypothetical protein
MKNANTRLFVADPGEARGLDPAVDAAREIGPRARDLEDDFFCLRFGVWYPSFDCAIRTRYRTCPSCRDCEQGRFNLKRHGSALAQLRRPFCRP